MRKSFDDLTIADDFMFCKVMQDEAICKQFLEMVLSNKIGKIAYLSPQNSVAAGIEAKSVRLDVFVKNGELVSWRRSGWCKRAYQFYKKSCNRNFRRNKNLETSVKGNYYRKCYELQYAWI